MGIRLLTSVSCFVGVLGVLIATIARAESISIMSFGGAYQDA